MCHEIPFGFQESDMLRRKVPRVLTLGHTQSLQATLAFRSWFYSWLAPGVSLAPFCDTNLRPLESDSNAVQAAGRAPASVHTNEQGQHAQLKPPPLLPLHYSQLQPMARCTKNAE
jgi:hypothetical protein